MPTITLNDTAFYYERHGHGPHLVMICGFGVNLTRWQELVEPLARKFHVTLFDNRGSGRTDAPEPPYSIKMMANDTAALMHELNISDAFVLGHSMGSAILQQLCISHPKLVKKGILLSSFERLLPHATFQIETLGKLFAAEVPFPLILETFLPWLYGHTFIGWPGNIEKAMNTFMSDPYPQTPNGFIGQSAALKTFDSRADLSKISTPLLIVTGEEDLYTPPLQAEYLHTHIPHSTLKIIPKCGHLVPQEKPQELLELMYHHFS